MKQYDKTRFEEDYFKSGENSNYTNYQSCNGVVRNMGEVIYNTIRAFKIDIKSMLDVGCAYGFLVHYFQEKGIDSHGCDVSNYALSQAHEAIKGRLTVAYLPELKIEPARDYDLIVASEVLEHLYFEDIRPAVKKMVELANKICIFTIAISTGNDFDEDPNDKTHISMLTRESWDKVFDDLGLTRNYEMEKHLSEQHFSKSIGWSNRFIVIIK